MTTATQSRLSRLSRLSTVIVAICLGAGCSISGSGTTASPEPGQTGAIDLAPTTPSIPPPVAAPTAATPEATATATAPVSETPTDPVEAEVVAAWERYLDLSIRARGKNPSPTAVDFGSYVVGPSLDALQRTADDDQRLGQYVRGTVLSSGFSVELAGAHAVVMDCVLIDLELVRRTDETVVGAQRQSVATVGRAKLIGERWLIEGQESGEPCG